MEAAQDISSDQFGEAIVDWLRQHVDFDRCVVFGYRGTSRPLALFDTFTDVEYQVFVSRYQEGPYLLDPFHHAAIERREGFWRMRELAPDRFYASEYSRSYYSETKLAEEVGFFVPLADKNSIVLSLMRLHASGPFGTADVRLLRDMAPVVVSLCRMRWPALPASEQDVANLQEREERADEFGRTNIWERLSLTTREADIVGKVLQGHSTESIARLLGISPGTVKVHRRNIHKKLGINSQAGLFTRFIEIIESEAKR